MTPFSSCFMCCPGVGHFGLLRSPAGIGNGKAMIFFEENLGHRFNENRFRDEATVWGAWNLHDEGQASLLLAQWLCMWQEFGLWSLSIVRSARPYEH
jgi:hypothetical protein